MELKYIDLILENCDRIRIDGKYVGEFLVDNICTSFYRIACNAIEKMEVAKDFAIEIHKDANISRSHFDLVEEEFTGIHKVFDRLKEWEDITSIEFDLDGEHYHYYVDWVGENDMINEAQKTYISDLGNCYIVISENKNIDDFFDRDQINDEAYMDYCFAMYNVGDQYNNPDKYKEVDS